MQHLGSKKLLRLALRLAGAYALLWGVTAWMGTRQLEAQARQSLIDGVLAGMQETIDSLRELGDDPALLEALEAHYGNGIYDGGEGQSPRLFCSASCPAPFLVRLESSIVSGPLAGRGREEVLVWFFGLSFELFTTREWIS